MLLQAHFNITDVLWFRTKFALHTCHVMNDWCLKLHMFWTISHTTFVDLPFPLSLSLSLSLSLVVFSTSCWWKVAFYFTVEWDYYFESNLCQVKNLTSHDTMNLIKRHLRQIATSGLWSIEFFFIYFVSS